MGQTLCPALHANSVFPLSCRKNFGGAFLADGVNESTGKKDQGSQDFLAMLPLTRRGPLEIIPFKDNIFCLTMKAL